MHIFIWNVLKIAEKQRTMLSSDSVQRVVSYARGVCVCVCLAYTSEDFHMKTLRHTEDSTPSEDPKTGHRKTLAKNTENVMFYHLRGVRAPRTSMDFQPYLIYEDIRVLGSISKASRCVCVCVCVWCQTSEFCTILPNW